MENTSVWTLPLAFTIKALTALAFLYLYTFIYGDNKLSEDAGAFMEESKIVQEVYYASPSDYFQLITGTGDQEKLTQKYLTGTSHWDAGDQSVLNDTKNLLKFHSLLHFFSMNSAFIHALLMCFLSLIGVIFIVRSIVPKTRLSPDIVFWTVFLLPNMLFWSSGILKEPLMVLGIGLMIFGLTGGLKISKSLLFTFSGLLILLLFKSYLLLALIPALIFYMIYHFLPRFKLIGGISLTILIITLTAILFKDLTAKSVHYLSRKQFDFINVACGGLHADTDSTFYYFRPDQYHNLIFDGDSVQLTKKTDALILQHGQMAEPIPVTLEPDASKWHIYFMNDRCNGFIPIQPIRGDFVQLLKNIPEAILNALFRPYPTDPGSWLKYPAMLETLLIFLLLGFAILKRRKLNPKEKGLIGAIVIFCLSLALLIGWITPVIGAIVRYRIPVYLGILMIALILINGLKKQP